MRTTLFLTLGLLAALGAAAACSTASPAPTAEGAEASLAPDGDSDGDGDDDALASTEAPPAPAAPPVHEGSAVARAPGGEAVYVADEDHQVLRRIPLPLTTGEATSEIALPGAPAQVLALADRLLVTIRDPGLLLVMRPDAEAGAVEIGRVALPADAWGVAVTPDERTAIVTSAWTHRVTGVDLETLEPRFSLDVAREPRAVVVRPDGVSAYVTHLVGTAITRLAWTEGIEGEEASAQRVDLAAAPLQSPRRARAEEAEVDASLAYSAALSPDGQRLFVPRHALGALGKRSWFGQATVDVLLTADDTGLVPPRRREHVGMNRTSEVGEDITLSSDGAVPVQEEASFVQPRAVVYRRSTRTLLVASEGGNAVAELDALAIDPSIRPLRRYELSPRWGGWSIDTPERDGCGAPSGIALSPDEARAYVYCRTSDTLEVVDLDPRRQDVTFRAAPPLVVHLAASALDGFAWSARLYQVKDPPPPAVSLAIGRRLFYDANDPTVSEGLGCAGCHPDGRDDGHVHQEIKHADEFSLAGGPIRRHVDGQRGMDLFRGHPRQTPMLAGRVDAEGPYGWHGESTTLVKRIQAGFQIHRWSGSDNAVASAEANDYPSYVMRAQAIAAFLRKGLVAPPRDVHPLTAEEVHGRELFFLKSTGCAGCHVPEGGYTDRIPIALGPADDVPGVLAEDNRAFKTPSLRFVGGTPPYFHDGRAPTLEALVDDNHDRMGHTEKLSRRDRAALVAFLRTL